MNIKSRARVCAYVLLVPTALAVVPGQVQAQSVPSAVPEQYQAERELFQQANKALGEGKSDEFQRLREELGTDYPIAHYLDYLELNRRFSAQKPSKAHVAELNAFERDSSDDNLTKKLTRLLQRRAAQPKNWTLFDGLSKSNYAASMPCEQLQSQASAGQLDKLNEASTS